MNGIRNIEAFFDLRSGFIAETLQTAESIIIKPGIVVHTAETFVWPSLTGQDFGPNGYCLALRDQAAILVDGTVVPCCLDGNGNLSLGNVLHEEWETILSSDRAQSIYRSFSDRKITEPLCRRCGYRTRFFLDS